jgi:hypothetical protein
VVNLLLDLAYILFVAFLVLIGAGVLVYCGIMLALLGHFLWETFAPRTWQRSQQDDLTHTVESATVYSSPERTTDH